MRPRMPRVKGAGVSAPKKPKVTKGHKLPEKFPEGVILRDVYKKNWRLGGVVGQGGFGLIYFVSNDVEKKCGADAEHVVKIEPHANGPLFCELHFYQRAATATMVDEWIRSRKLKYLGVPKFITFGSHDFQGQNYRFLVMSRFSTDLQKMFEAAGKRFSAAAVYALGLRLIDDLEYLHDKEYVHADIKAANLLLGHQKGKTVPNRVYLVDYGLAYRYTVEGKHKEYKEDPRRAHDGTIEFTSRDAHNGVFPSRRGDFEILGYCLLQWMCGCLPWEDKLADKKYVQQMKIKYMGNIPSLMKKCFPQGSVPVELQKYLEMVSKLKYDDRPDYNKLRALFRSALSSLGQKDEWILNLPVDGKRPSTPKKPVKRAIASPKPQSTHIKTAKVTANSPLPMDAENLQTKPAGRKITANSPLPMADDNVKPKGRKKVVHAVKAHSPLNPKYATPRMIKDSAGHKSPSPRKAVTARQKLAAARQKMLSPGQNGIDPDAAKEAKMKAAARRRMKRKDVESTEMGIQTSPGLSRQ